MDGKAEPILRPFLLFLLMVTAAAGQTKPIPIGVKVEAEGGGKAQGMWSQAAKDLTPTEASTLHSLIVAEIKKQEGVKIVPLDYSEDFIAVVVVAAKLPNGNTGKNWQYIASSAVIVATKNGMNEFVTHDVFAGADLTWLARTVAYQLATARFRAATGLWR